MEICIYGSLLKFAENEDSFVHSTHFDLFLALIICQESEPSINKQNLNWRLSNPSLHRYLWLFINSTSCNVFHSTIYLNFLAHEHLSVYFLFVSPILSLFFLIFSFPPARLSYLFLQVKVWKTVSKSAVLMTEGSASIALHTVRRWFPGCIRKREREGGRRGKR